MATAFSPTTGSYYHLKNQFHHVSINSSQLFIPSPALPYRPFHRLRKILNFRSSHCLAAAPDSPQPDSDPSPPQEPTRNTGISRIQDRAQIFTAVLFWMSLFFWSSAWDGRNNGGPKKGPPFK